MCVCLWIVHHITSCGRGVVDAAQRVTPRRSVNNSTTCSRCKYEYPTGIIGLEKPSAHSLAIRYAPTLVGLRCCDNIAYQVLRPFIFFFISRQLCSRSVHQHHSSPKMRPNSAARKRGVACGGGVYSGGGAGWMRQQQQQQQQLDSRLSDGIESPLGPPSSPGGLLEPVATGGRSIAGALVRLQQRPSRRGGGSFSYVKNTLWAAM